MKLTNAIAFRVSKIVQKNKFVKDILYSINQQSGRALLVGGAVRDIFLDLPIKDLDFEVYGLSLEQLQKILEQFGQVSLIGKSFGVLRLHGLDVDWSLPRKDSSGRHPVVAYDPFMPYEQAFARRDLTINAMGIDMKTMELVDPFHGLQDLHNKILKAPDLNFFGQDPLRLLRVMQFASRFEMRVDEALTQLCKDMDITKLSVERVEQEFKKLFLQGKRISDGLAWLDEIGKFNYFFPHVQFHEAVWKKLNFAAKVQYKDDEEKLVIMYALILSYIPSTQKLAVFQQITSDEKEQYMHVLRKLVLPEARRKAIVTCLLYAYKATAKLNDVQMKWLAYWIAPEISIRMLAQFMLIRFDQDHALKVAEQSCKLGVLDKPEQPLLTGKDFLDVAQGAQLGCFVKKAYELQLEQSIIDDDILKSLVLQS